MIRIQLDIGDVQAVFARMAEAGVSMRPFMDEAGDMLVESTKQRFETSTAPDGSRWEPNSELTYLHYLGKYSSSFEKEDTKKRKAGQISAKGKARAMAKKPLIGETGRLAESIFPRATDNSVSVGSDRVYAGVMQFGAKQGEFGRTRRNGPIPWGDIPARPFVGLSPEDQVNLIDLSLEHIARAADGGS